MGIDKNIKQDIRAYKICLNCQHWDSKVKDTTGSQFKTFNRCDNFPAGAIVKELHPTSHFLSSCENFKQVSK